MALDLEHLEARRFSGTPMWRPDTLPLLWLMVLVLLMAIATTTSWTGYHPLPPIATTAPWRLANVIVAGVDRRGEIYLRVPGENFVHTGPGRIPAAVRAALASHPRAGVDLIADQDADQRRVDVVLAALRSAGVREVVLVTRESRRQKPRG